MDDDAEITVVRAIGGSTAARPRGPASLTVLSGHELGRTHRLVASETVIGRGTDVDFQIDDDGVSRRHAKVVRDPDGTIKIHDLGSTNGTYLNGKRIEIEALREGDRVRIGQAATLEVRYEHRDTREDPLLPPATKGFKGSSFDGLDRAQAGDGEFDRVLDSYRRSLAIREETLGGDHPSVASILADIGQVLRAQGKPAAALEQHERALAIYEQRVGSGIAPPEMAHLLTNIGQCHLDLGDAERALEVLERALEMLWERKASDRELAAVRFAVARALHALSRQPVRMLSLAKMARDALASAPDGLAGAKEIGGWIEKVEGR
jgi:hypothetical protein